MTEIHSLWYAFGPYRLNPHERRLFRNAEEVKLRSKTFEVLVLLVEQAGSVLTHEAIRSAVWKDVHVGVDVVIKSISEIRQALGDRCKPSLYIETFYRRGFRFVASVEITSKERPDTDQSSLFFGRAAEMQTISEVAGIAFGGVRRAALVTGAAGIGKTRLLQEAARLLAGKGALVLHARADNAAGYSPFWIWTQLVSDFARGVSPAELAECLGSAAADIMLVMPSLQDRLHRAGEVVVLEPELGRARFFDGIANLLSNIAARRPLVIAVDDLHRESASSLALLQKVMADPLPRRLLVIATSRPEQEVDNAEFANLAGTWCRDAVATEVKLSGLAEQETRDLIDSTAHLELSKELSERVARDSGGNPYFTLEILNWLRESDLATAHGTPSAYRIPVTVQRVVQERLQRCRQPTRALLRVATVLGTTFNARIAGQVAGLDATTLFSAISEALQAELLVESASSKEELVFRHDLIRETLWQSLLAIERADLHFRIGEVLENFSKDETVLPQLAYHFCEAGAEKALGYCLLAGKRASEHYSNVEAVGLLRQGLEIADRLHRSNNEETFDILEQLAEVYANIDKYDEADRMAERMHTLALAEANPLWLARAAIAMSARCFMPSRMQRGAQCIGALEQALATLPDDDSYLRGMVAARTALAMFAHNDAGTRRIELAGLAVSIARRQSDITKRGYLLRDAIMAYWDADHLAQRTELVDELRSCAQVARNLYLGGEAIAWHALSLLACGRFRDCDDYAVAVEPYIMDMHTPAAALYLRRVQFLLHLLRGRLSEAQSCLDEYLAVKEQAAAVLDAAEPLETMFLQLSILRERGIPLESISPIRGVASLFPHLPLRPALPYLLAEAGELEEARAEFEVVAANDFANLPPRNEAHCWLAALASLGDACAEIGDRKRAAVLYEMLQPYQQQWALVYYAAGIFGSIDRPLGRLAELRGDTERADFHFQRVFATCEREHVVTELIRSQLDYAAVLAARSGPHAGAATWLRQEALRRAQENDLPALRTRAQRSLTEPADGTGSRRQTRTARQRAPRIERHA